MDQGRTTAQNMVLTPAYMIYLDGLEPVSECRPGQEDNGPGEDSPRGPEAHCVDGAESNACLQS